jgi:gluconolactonase
MVIGSRNVGLLGAFSIMIGGGCVTGPDDEALYIATPLTEEGKFTPGIEGPACDRDGKLFAVNYGEQHTIGQISSEGEGKVFIRLPGESIGNGIRFDQQGMMYVADYTQHNVLKVDPRTHDISVHAHEPAMNQPNDLTIMKDGTLFASDPNWDEGTGQVWRIDTNGTVTLVAPNMGTTNGIEVSPDEKHLYVNESVQLNVWIFDIEPDRSLSNKRLFRKFDDFGFDGMRCDVDGNLYITRYSKGTVVKLSPRAQILEEIDVLGAKPSNICFGGPDGRTAYVTEVTKTRVVQFRVPRPGLAWQRLQGQE